MRVNLVNLDIYLDKLHIPLEKYGMFHSQRALANFLLDHHSTPCNRRNKATIFGSRLHTRALEARMDCKGFLRAGMQVLLVPVNSSNSTWGTGMSIYMDQTFSAGVTYSIFSILWIEWLNLHVALTSPFFLSTNMQQLVPKGQPKIQKRAEPGFTGKAIALQLQQLRCYGGPWWHLSWNP